MKLIDADALLEFIHNNFKAEWDYPSVEDVTEIITNAPTVEVGEHCCPECGCHFVGKFPFKYEIQAAPTDKE